MVEPLFYPFPFRQVGLVDRLYPQLSTCVYDLESVSLAGDIRLNFLTRRPEEVTS